MIDTSQFTDNGKYLMLALDHRGSIKKLMDPDDLGSVSDEQVTNLKREIINSLEDQFSGLLIDVGYGLKAYQGRTKPFLLPVEKSGYRNKGGERITEIGYSVEQLIDFGASGAKLLLYLNPDLPSASQQIETAKKVLQECRGHNFPLFLEIVTYELSGQNGVRSYNVLGALRMLIASNVIPDVWKLEYPGSAEACRQVTKTVVGTPWILLTRGNAFDHFVPQLEDAIKAGSKGFLAGRALWQEVCKLEGEEKEKFLKETLPERFKIIATTTSLNV